MGAPKMMRWLFSITVAFTLLFGTASHVFAAPPAHAEKLDVLVSFTEKPGSAEQALIENEGGKVKRKYHIVPTIAASIPKGKLESLRRNPKVDSVEEDITVEIIEERMPWGVDRIDAEVVHGQNKGGGVKVAILDTGIDLDHPDLRVTGDVTFVPDTNSGDDDNGHGTKVAGVVAALDNDIGVVGVAPEVELYAVKVLNRGGWGFCSDVLSGIEWAVDNDMQVINMSFGTITEPPTNVLRKAVRIAERKGIVLVAGAGNWGDWDFDGIIYPARYEPVIAVGAMDQQDTRASFSSTGSTLELMAPGVGILSTSRGGGYNSGSGTSFAAPHVTGIAALLIASGVTNNVEVRQTLQSMAKDLGPSGWDSWYGYGLVTANGAIGAQTKEESPWGSDTVPPQTRILLRGSSLTSVYRSTWYRSNVQVRLLAEDNIEGSGVAKTLYSVDGGEKWMTYQDSFIIDQEGITTLLAMSIDRAGNQEDPPVSTSVRIDKTLPIVSMTVSPDIIGPVSPKAPGVDVAIIGSAQDPSGGAGLFSIRLIVKDEYARVEPVIGPYIRREYLEETVQLEAWGDGRDLDGRVYTVSIIAMDYAGNEATAETIVVVPHDHRKEKVNNESAGEETTGATSPLKPAGNEE